MAVNLTISEALNGAAVSDTLAGAGNTGTDLGSVTTGSYAPVIDKPSNTGAQTLYIRHDGTNEITDTGFFIDTFSGTYGGADSAANDYSTLVAEGFASGSSKNNNDGLSSGLWIDMDADVTTTNQFDIGTFPTVVKIFGDNNTDGIDLASAFTLQSDAMVYDAPGETLASAPVDGEIGPASSTTLGDNAKIKLRIYLRTSFPNGGVVQHDFVTKYSFTS